MYINGGRLISVRDNYFENCDLAINFADPGTGHHKGVDQPTMGWDCACIIMLAAQALFSRFNS